MKLIVKSWSFIAIILVFSFLLEVSCQNKKDTLSDTKQTETQENPVSNGNTLVFGSSRNKDKTADTQVSPGFTETEKGDIRGQLLPLFTGTIIPEEMVIGPLQDMRTVDRSEGSFPDTVTSFFYKLKNGEIDEDLLHPDWKYSILQILNNRTVKSSYNVRIGKIIEKDEIKRVNIRLVSNVGRVSGEILGEKYEDKWLISSISVNFNQLQDVYVRENGEFSPMSYSNILLNY